MLPEETNIDHLTVRDLKNGNLKAFDILFEKYAGRLYNFSLKHLKSTEEAEEVVQEVFMYIWDKRDQLKPDKSFNAYIFTIAHNIIRKYFIKKCRENAYKDELIYNMLKEDNSLDRMIHFKLLLEKIEQIIETLPARRKEIFLKQKYDGLPVIRIAEDLKISPNTVENQLASARKYILAELKKEKISGIFFL